MDIQIENIRFCRQPTTIIQDDFLSINGERLTLDYLRQMNISAHQLLNRRCQYTFDSSDQFKDILWNRFDAKYYFQNDILTITNGTCYSIPHWECQSILCLDKYRLTLGKHSKG